MRCCRIRGTVSAGKTVTASLAHGQTITATVDKASAPSSPEYTGPYEAIPTWSQQVFDTDGCLMLDDFTVHSIIKQEVRNDAGGLTLTI